MQAYRRGCLNYRRSLGSRHIRDSKAPSFEANGVHGIIRRPACAQGGTLSILGVYGVMDKFPLGVLMNKGVTVRTAQRHGQAHVPRLLEHAQRGELTPAALATHHFSLEESPTGYHMFKHKEDGCLRAVFSP